MLNVLYGGDRLTLRGIYLSMRSMLKHNTFPIHFYILTMEVDDKGEKGRKILEEDRLFLEKLAKRFNQESVVSLFDYTDRYRKTIRNTRNNKSTYSPYCMLRLYSEEILPNENVLYLDADTLINDSLSSLLEIDISDVELIATPDFLGQWWVHPGYFNSGVLYLNGKKIKESHLFSRSIELLMHKTYFFADQSALNNLVKDFRFMDRRYNEQRAFKKDTVIGHFCKRISRFYAPIRPWDVKGMRETYKIKCLDDVYKDYLNEFPFEKIGLNKPDYNF